MAALISVEMTLSMLDKKHGKGCQRITDTTPLTVDCWIRKNINTYAIKYRNI
jgi:hypothetical protein